MFPQTISHYRILQKLGAGGMGEVYLAEDTRLGRRVALKLLPSAFTTNDERVRRFEQEARAASALNHPNIITIHEIGEAEVGRFIVMEFVQGRTLRAMAGARPTLESFSALGSQIARALDVAHGAGIIHRDIKPENIMVRDDGYVKVLDFGLARLVPQNLVGMELDTQTGSIAGGLIGTALYMSPEQARGDQAGSASDIFSLGMVFYELVTGQHPFKGRSTLALLHAITSQLVPPPSRIRLDLAPAIDALITQMLEKEARLRPTAAQVEAALLEIGRVGEGEKGKVGERERKVVVSPPLPLSPSPPPYPSFPPTLSRSASRKVVGRERERGELRAGFESAVAGQGMLLCVAGEPGIGKTTLVEDFLSELMTGDQPCRFARGRCSERLAGTEAYLPWLEALDSLLHSETGESLARTMRFGSDSPTRLMKLLAPTWYIQVAPPSADISSEVRSLTERTAASQERMKLELSALLQEVSRLRPLVLFFDDLHWSDASTIDLITYLAGKFDMMRLLIIVTYRTSDLLLTKHPFLQIKPDLQARGVCREIALDFLIRAEIERYLSLEFPGHQFPEKLPELIHAKTEGNPLFMTDLVRYLRDRRVITEERGHWVLAGSLPQIERELPESVRGMIERKIAQLGADDRRLLMAASVQGYEFDSSIIAESLKIDPAEVEERLEELERVHAFVRIRGEKEFPDHTLTLRYRFVHVLYQNELYAQLRPTRRVALSGAMAQALLKHYGEKSAAVASELANLFSIARDFAHASQYYLIAAKDAAEVFAHEEAAELARRGLEMLKMAPEMSAHPQQELALQLTLGTSLSFARGHSLPEAGKSMTRARELCEQMGEPPQLFTVIFALWSYYIVGAKLPEARKMAEQLLRTAENTQDPMQLLGAHYTLGTTLQFLAEISRGHEHLERAFSYYDPQQRPAYRSLYRVDPGAFCLSETVRTLWLLGYPEQARRRLDEALELAGASSDPHGMAFAMVKAVFLHQTRREVQQAEEWAERCLAHCNEHGIAQARFWVKSVLGWVVAVQGRVEEGLAQMRESIDAYRALCSGSSVPHYLTLLADVLGFAGRPSEGLNVITEALELVRRTGDCHSEAETYRIKGELLLSSGLGMTDFSSERTRDGQYPQFITYEIDPASLNSQSQHEFSRNPQAEAEAEDCFRHAIDLAQRHKAKSWELRAATSLSRLWRQQGKREEARQLLTPIYDWFTEGFDTGDLREAKALLVDLS